MAIYLRDIPLPEAQARFTVALQEAGLWGLTGIEEIVLDEHCAGRVLAETVWAQISSPHYHASAMDGYAVRAVASEKAMPNSPVLLLCGIEATYVDTGDALPIWADAVIPIENVEPLDQSSTPAADPRRPFVIRIRSAVAPWSHVRPLGEDIVATQLVLPAGHTLRPIDLGAIAASGHDRIRVARRPRVGIIPTGSELVPVGRPVEVGEIIEYNSIVMAAQVNSWGGEAVRFPITPDDDQLIGQRTWEAAQTCDLVLLNAGSSAGSEDYTSQVVERLGTLLVHGVAVRPGHPVVLGMIDLSGGNQASSTNDPGSNLPQSPITNRRLAVPIIGVPGYPVSAALTCELFVRPVLTRWLGKQPEQPANVKAILTRKVTSPAGDDDFLRLALGKVGKRLLAAPLSRGAGVITSLVRADGIALIPRGSQGISAGEEIIVQLYRPMAEIERTILAIGSHDLILDIIAQHLAGYGLRLSSANVGSLGGLIALQRDEAHLAGSHLLDTDTGEYNLSYIRQYLPGIPVKVVALAERQQGLLVAKGNPKDIRSLNDLVREDVVFINRQRGAGTRILLDYQLIQQKILTTLSIAPERIRGYNQEEYTHLAIAAAVSSGKADCGLGIAAAAQALKLDFIPLFQERYDLVIPDRYYHNPLLVPLLQIIRDEQFHQVVTNLPGYNINSMGKMIAEVG